MATDAEKRSAGLVGIGAAACAACCAGPIDRSARRRRFLTALAYVTAGLIGLTVLLPAWRSGSTDGGAAPTTCGAETEPDPCRRIQLGPCPPRPGRRSGERPNGGRQPACGRRTRRTRRLGVEARRSATRARRGCSRKRNGGRWGRTSAGAGRSVTGSPPIARGRTPGCGEARDRTHRAHRFARLRLADVPPRRNSTMRCQGLPLIRNPWPPSNTASSASGIRSAIVSELASGAIPSVRPAQTSVGIGRAGSRS